MTDLRTLLALRYGRFSRIFTLASAVCLCACGAGAQPDAALRLEATIPLTAVVGRIDHLALDVAGARLFVAALGNGSVEVIDLQSGRIVQQLPDLKEPQGLAWLPERDTLIVASGNGEISFYQGRDLALAGTLKVAADADNVRLDPSTGLVIVGYGDGALAIIDPVARKVIGSVALPSHPEGFRLDVLRHRAFVNLPGSGTMATVDLAARKVVTSRKAAHAAAYPMQFDAKTNRVLTVYRLPARFAAIDAETGAKVADLPVCGDSDDLFIDDRRHRIYVSCGSGDIDVLSETKDGYRRAERIRTRPGARTSLYAPEVDRLFVAARAQASQGAAILVFEPLP